MSVSEAALISFGCDDIRTEAETPCQVRRRRAIVTRRVVPLAGIGPVPFCQQQPQMQSRAVGRDLRQWYVSSQMWIFCGDP